MSMKIVTLLSVLVVSTALLAACGNANQPVRNGAVQEYSSQTGVKSPAPVGKTPGKVTINFDYQRMRKMASDQLAVWIEDTQGKHVRTLLVTRFTANGGYQKRAEAVPDWQKVFQPATTSQEVLDAVSSATPQSGPVAVMWDCLNQAGEAVPDGSYVYKVEANIEWAKTALWQGTITVGPTAGQSTATPTAGDGILLQAVRADFVPTP
jgi:hypothetical protein